MYLRCCYVVYKLFTSNKFPPLKQLIIIIIVSVTMAATMFCYSNEAVVIQCPFYQRQKRFVI